MKTYMELNTRVQARMAEDEAMMQATEEAAQRLTQIIADGGTILVCGNGGSAAQAQHMVAELTGRMSTRRRPIRAISLCADTATMTCIANDYGFENIFSRQVQAYGQEGDALVTLTTSGTSRNLHEAIAMARAMGMYTLVISGMERNRVDELADTVLHVPSLETTIVQEIQLQITHYLCQRMEQALPPEDKGWERVIRQGRFGRKTLLLDRDGVINRKVANGYVTCWEDFCFRPEFLEAAPRLGEVFDRVYVMTNQKCIAQGLVTHEGMHSIHTLMQHEAEARGLHIDQVYLFDGMAHNKHLCKPSTGMIDLMMSEHPEVTPTDCIFVGDSAQDMLMATRAGIEFAWIKE